MRRIHTFQRGSCEGLLVLAFDLSADGIDPGEAAKIAAAELAQRPGLFGVHFEGAVDWGADRLPELIDACGSSPILACRDLDSTAGWPAVEINWIVDASRIVRECKSDRALAARLGQQPWLPPVRDLIVELEVDQLPPAPEILGMIAAHSQPCGAFVYIPRDYPYRALLLAHLAACSSTAWAVRWI